MPATLPPYLGTWDSLLQALLHDPTLGGGGHKPLHRTHLDMMQPASGNGASEAELPEFSTVYTPQPDPWRAASALLLGAIGAQFADGSNGGHAAGIAELVDEFCGTPPHPFPWWLITAAEIGSLGEHMPDGKLREGVLECAGRLIQKTLGAEASNAGAMAGSRT